MEDFCMDNIVEYANIAIYGNADLEELEIHLSRNGYDFGIDKKKNILFVIIDELSYVETILADRDIVYGVRVY
jgi:hypothetical protein